MPALGTVPGPPAPLVERAAALVNLVPERSREAVYSLAALNFSRPDALAAALIDFFGGR